MSILKFQNHTKADVDGYGVFQNLWHNHGVIYDDLHFCVHVVCSVLTLSTEHVKRGFTTRTVCNVKIILQGRKKDDGLDWISSNCLFCTNYQSLGKCLRNVFSQFRRKWPWPCMNWRKSRSSLQEHKELIWRALGSFTGNKHWEE